MGKKFMKPLGIDLPLTNVRIETAYWKADVLPNNGRSNFKTTVVSEECDELYGCYLIPEYEYPGLIKVNSFIMNNKLQVHS